MSTVKHANKKQKLLYSSQTEITNELVQIKRELTNQTEDSVFIQQQIRSSLHVVTQ